MAKYDSYTLTYIKTKKPEIQAVISVLFEDGDNISEVMAEARREFFTEVNKIESTKVKSDDDDDD